MDREPGHPAADIAASEAILDHAERELEELLGPEEAAAAEPAPEPGTTPSAPVPATRVTHERPALERITMERAALAPHPRWRRFVARVTQPCAHRDRRRRCCSAGRPSTPPRSFCATAARAGAACGAIDRADVTVAVLNGTSVNGLAGNVGSDVEASGYVLGPVSSTTPGVEKTAVLYADGQKRAAQRSPATSGSTRRPSSPSTARRGAWPATPTSSSSPGRTAPLDQPRLRGRGALLRPPDRGAGGRGARRPRAHPDLVLEVTSQPSLIVDDDARITFFVRESDDHARVAIVDSTEDVVRTLDPDVELTEGEEVTYEWDRSTDAGGRAPPGATGCLSSSVRGPGDGLATADNARHGVRRRGLNAPALEVAGMLIACGSAAAALLSTTAGSGWGDGHRVGSGAGARPRRRLGRAAGRRLPREPGADRLLLVGVVALAALVLAFRRWREAFPIAAFAVLPLRVPIEIGGETANLLVALPGHRAGLIVFALDDPRAPKAEEADRWSLWLRRLLAATLVLYAIQASYSEDVPNAIENIGFFLVPFAVMFALLTAVQWTRALLGRVLAVVAGVAVVCALIAIYQWSAGTCS